MVAGIVGCAVAVEAGVVPAAAVATGRLPLLVVAHWLLLTFFVAATVVVRCFCFYIVVSCVRSLLVRALLLRQFVRWPLVSIGGRWLLFVERCGGG